MEVDGLTLLDWGEGNGVRLRFIFDKTHKLF